MGTKLELRYVQSTSAPNHLDKNPLKNKGECKMRRREIAAITEINIVKEVHFSVQNPWLKYFCSRI